METSDRTVEFISTVTTMTVIAFCAVFLRLFSKAKYGKEVMLDDNLMVVAWLLTLGSLALLLASVANFGYTLHQQVEDKFPKGAAALISVAQALSSCSGAAAKTSAALLLWRITPVFWQRALLKTTTAITILTTLIVAVVMSVKINDNNMQQECVDRTTAWNFGIFYAVWGVISDFILSLLPWIMVWKLRMKKAEKYGLAVALSMGCVTSILGIMKLSYINCVSVLDLDLSYTSIDLITYHFVEPTVIITAASIPALRFFLHNQVTAMRRSCRASELLDMTNPITNASRASRRSFLPRPPAQAHQHHHPLVDSESMISLSAMFRSLPPSAEDPPPMPPIRSMPVARVGVAGASSSEGRNMTTVTTITGGHNNIRSASSNEQQPKEGEILRTVRVVVSSEGEGSTLTSEPTASIRESYREPREPREPRERSWNTWPSGRRESDLEMGDVIRENERKGGKKNE
ncbi:hypothetical protein QC762_500505 [Podospora pseudocomata]|uniref:Rhodopsin domain-containing protein n=1 Tax=Podospora pseudocomata TaxID=2093779 RepID=A0ABR0GAG6_9PEZI|nr:hypothetical protein QC762_500505 [Podospora pseudocomata]